MSTVKNIIKFEKISDEFKELAFKKTKGVGDDYDTTYYDIFNSSKKKVGEVTNVELTGLFYGNLYNKSFGFHTFEVRGGGDNPKKNMKSWFKTNTFKKWAGNIDINAILVKLEEVE